MIKSPRIVLDVPQPARAVYLAQAYRDIIENPDVVAKRLEPLRRIRGHAIVDRWIALSRESALVDLSMALMQEHYDLAYDKSRQIESRDVLAVVSADTLDDAGQEAAADAIVAALAKAP
jgi:tRNA 2-selenouridine synthase